MTLLDRLLADPWLRGWALAGGLGLAVSCLEALPWLLWTAWAYLGVLSVVDVLQAGRRPTRARPT